MQERARPDQGPAPEALRTPRKQSVGGADLTALLLRWRRGDHTAGNRLMSIVYPRLKAIAASHLRGERGDVSVQTNGLVHELYLRFVGSEQPEWEDRRHFFAVATLMIRHILVDRARRRAREKRGGGAISIPLEDAQVESAPEPREVDLLDLDLALTTLSTVHPEAARLVELRFFGGLTIEETAAVMDLSRSTATRRWRAARACLRKILQDNDAAKA